MGMNPDPTRDPTGFRTARAVLFWCAVIDYAFLTLWFLAFVWAHDWMFRMHGRWFHVSVEQFDALHYGGMALFKVGILMFNVAPWVALGIVDGRSRR
jgi:hypothetical protein